jgi:hypothetical protein
MIQTKLYSNDIWKQKLRQISVPKASVEHIKTNERSYPYLYPIKDLVQGNFYKGFHVAPIKEASWEAS